MKFHRALPLVLASIALVGAGPATTQPIGDLSSTVDAVFLKHSVPALVGAIVELDGPTGIGASGLRRSDGKAAMELDDPIHIGSCTKSMTALLIGRLVDQKKLHFETTMKECFPALGAKMDPTMAAVTVRQLLDHRAGLPANVDWRKIDADGGSPTQQRVRVAQLVLCAKPQSKPGDTYVYSNVGYTLLGAIVDARSDAPWEKAIQKQIFVPLGMNSAGFGPPEGDAPWGHASAVGKLVPTRVDNPPVMNPAGRVHCSMQDWSRYIAACLRASGGDTDLISAATFKELTTPPPGGDYAGGWITTQRPWAGGRTLTHAGSNNTWYCVAWLAPERGFAVLAATNCATADGQQACDDVAATLIGKHAGTK